MRRRGVSRRNFLRLSGISAASRWMGLSGLPQLPRLKFQAGVTITLLGGNADIWAWERVVRGAIGPDCDMVMVDANGAIYHASIDGDRFAVTVPIAEGENTIAATCHHEGDQTVTLEPLNYTGKLRNVPRSNITISIDGDRVVLDGRGSEPAPQNGTPLTTYRWTARDNNPAPLTVLEPPDAASPLLSVEADSITLAPPEADGEYYVTLTVTDEDGHEDRSETYFRVVGGQPELDDWATENTDWVENVVCYGVIPRNFGSPGFQAVIDRLDDLADLGINALWLAPINVSPAGDYGYAVSDYFDVNSRYGTLDDFRRMVQEAHARGIRVLMDFVPNHSSDQHPYFRDALMNGANSPYWDFYARDDQGMHTHYFTWTNLPNLNYENPEVRNWMTEAFKYWVREFDVDGFRVDVAWGIRERRPDYWPVWRQELKRIKSDLLLLAEASATDDYYFSNGFDAAYDWTAQLGNWAWQRVWEDRELLTYNLDSALTYRRSGGYDEDAVIFRFLNNNDTDTRFVARYGPEMTRVATAMLLTLPGIPCVYTGDEVGALFTPYGDSGPISFRERIPGFRDYHRHLIHLRRNTPSLHSRHWIIVPVEPHQQVYGYLRNIEDGSQPILVLLNFADNSVDIEVPMVEGFPSFVEFFTRESFQDLLAGETVTPSGTGPLRFTVAPLTALILS